MKEFEVVMDASALVHFLHFLVRTTSMNSVMLQRLINRLMSDDGHPISHKECVILTLFLHRNIPKHERHVTFNFPRNFQLDYLRTYPNQLNEVLGF